MSQNLPGERPENVLRRRIKRIKKIHKEANNNLQDLELLYRGPHPFKRRRGPPQHRLFATSNMAAEEQEGVDYIIQRLALLMEKTFEPGSRESAWSRVENGPARSVSGVRGGSRFCDRDAFHIDNETVEFQELFEFAVQTTESDLAFLRTEEPWAKLRLAYGFLSHLKRLIRFADLRNPETNVKPLADGANLWSRELRASWALHRAWIRLLHYRSLEVGDYNPGQRQLRQIYALTRNFLSWESGNIRKANLGIDPTFNVLPQLLQTVRSAITAIANEVYSVTPEFTAYAHAERQRTGQEVLGSREEILYVNSKGDVFRRIVDTHLGDETTEWHLLATLLERADDFENKMEVEHVEDYLFNKRIVIEDEKYELAELFTDPFGYDPSEFKESIPREEKYLESLYYNFVREISVVNSNRRNYLLLRDWSKKRPWKQLYYVFDTESDKLRPLATQINNFYNRIDAINNGTVAPHMARDSPSRRANVFASFFPIHPIASHGMAASRLADTFKNPCVVCQDEYRPGSSVAQLHCNHYVHWLCFLGWMDTPGRYAYDCPQCRTGGSQYPFQLYKQVDIEPEVADVWDNVDNLDPKTALDFPNMPGEMGEHSEEQYWYIEKKNLKESENWEADHGPDQPRSLNIEMVRMRERRRKFNKIRREHEKAMNRGMQADYDPTVKEEFDPDDLGGQWEERNGELHYVKN